MLTGALLQVTERQWRLHKLRVALTILGVALGVAVFFAIRTTNITLVDSLHSTIERLAGKATLQVIGGESGFAESYLSAIRVTPGVELAEPVTETTANVPSLGNEKLLVLGLDTASYLKIYSDMYSEGGLAVSNPLAFASRGDSIAVSRKFAGRFGLKDGDKLSLLTQKGTINLTIRGFFESSGASEVFDGNVAVMDIYAAQDAFGRGSRIDRIDIKNTSDVAIDDLQQRITAQLPAGIKAVKPELRGQALENSISSMHFGMTIMSFLAFIICAFLIFNSFSISLNQRWKEIGILRSVGVERANVQRMFLAESVVVGLIGSAIGIATGYFLARAALRVIIGVTSTVYGFTSSPKALEFNYTFAAEAFLAGIVVSLFAAWLPARAAARLDPVSALHNIENQKRGWVTGTARVTAGLVLVILGVLLTRFSTQAVDGRIQLFYAFTIGVGMVLLLPKMIQIGATLLRPVMDLVFGAEGLIAVETLVRAPRRTSSTVGALMIGLGFVLSSGALIYSQKAAINRSLDKALDADILVTSSEQLQSRAYHFTDETAKKITSLPEIETSDALRVTTVEYGGDDITILAHEMNAYFDISPDLLDSGDRATARAATSRGEGVLISNNLGLRFGLGLGDRIKIDSPGGTLDMPIVGMLDYFRSEKGSIFIDRGLYRKYWNDSDVDYILINLKPGIDHAAFKQQVQAAISNDRNSYIYTHDEYKQWVTRLIDQFFSLMYLQMLVAIFVAALGLMNTMVISVDERKRELGIFRAIGGSRRQMVKMVLLEALAISLIGLGAGSIAGVLNAYFLVNTAARAVAGFTLKFYFPLSLVFMAIPIVIVIAIFSAWLPALRAARLNPVEAIGYE